MPEAVRIPETAFAVAPDYFGSVFREGKWTRYYLDERGEPIIPVLDVSKPAHRNRWALENMRVFSDGTVVSPAERWKRSIGPSIIDDWLSELRFAASREEKKKKTREEKKEFRGGVKETELDIKAMMAVSASARAMEVSAGSAAAYVQAITGGDSNLDKQDFWGEFLLHKDRAKLIRVIKNPLVRHYYEKILNEAGIRPKSLKEDAGWIGSWDWKREGRGTDKQAMDAVLGGRLVRFLEHGEGHESLDDYLSELVTEEEEKEPEFSTFIEKCKELLVVEEGEEIDDGIRWAAARLAADAFLVHYFTEWEYQLDQRRLELQKETKDEGRGINLRPSPGWGGNPLRAVLEPKFLPARIKKMYGKEDDAILRLTDFAFRPEKIFAEAQNEFDKKPEDKKSPKDRPELLKPSMTTHLKMYARYSDALWTFLGSSRGIAIPQWTRDTMEKDLPRVAEMLDQVYGNTDEPRPNTGKQIVGAMMARIIQCKALAAAVESTRPGFRGKMRFLFGEERDRPFLEAMQAIWGPNLDAESGYLAALAGGRTRLVFRGNSEAEKALSDAWNLLATSDQDPKGRQKAKNLAILKFVFDTSRVLAEMGGRKR